MLPDLNGYEVCKILKSSKGTSLIPLVIVTARIAAENRIESFCLGADDYIAKPYTPDQIFQALEQSIAWLDQARSGHIQGIISFDSRDDGEILRRLGQLRSLIFARTGAGPGIGGPDQPGNQGSLVPGRGMAPAQPLRPILDPDLYARDGTAHLDLSRPAGWLGRVRELPEEDPIRALVTARFDEVIPDEAERCLTLVKDLPPT